MVAHDKAGEAKSCSTASLLLRQEHGRSIPFLDVARPVFCACRGSLILLGFNSSFPKKTGSCVPSLTDLALKEVLRLRADADLTRSFSDLGVDSWDFIEARVVLETKFDLYFTDDEWMALERPADILVRRSAA